MSVTRGQHPGLRRIRDARGLRQPPARQAWAEDRVLEPGERSDRRLRLIIRLGLFADGQFAHLRGPWADTETFSAIAATLTRHNAIVNALSTKPESFEPLFVRTPNGEVDARDWCMGFYAVIKLRLLAWSRLMSPNTTEHGLLLPILFHCVDPSGCPVLDLHRRRLAAPSFAHEAWRDIPTVVEAMRQFWMPSRFARVTYPPEQPGQARVCSYRLHELAAHQPSISLNRMEPVVAASSFFQRPPPVGAGPRACFSPPAPGRGALWRQTVKLRWRAWFKPRAARSSPCMELRPMVRAPW